MTNAAGTDGNGVERTLFRILIALVALAPLPLASNRPLPAALLALCAGILLVVWSLHASFGKTGIAFPVARIRWPLILFGATAFWIAVQALPIAPAGLADPIWAEASQALHTPLGASISVNPGATLTGLMRLLSYAAIFWLALQLGGPSREARLAVTSIALIGAAYALYGLVIYAMGNETVLIYSKTAYRSALSSTFINRNSFATFAGLALLAAVAWFVNGFRHLLTIKRPLRQRMAMIAETIFGRGILRTLAVLALLMALVLTGSRAGVASGLVGLFVLLLTFMRGNTLRLSHAVAIAGGIGLAVAAVLLVNGELLASRLATLDGDASTRDRGTVYTATIEAIGSAPWTGTGFGTYREVFVAYRPEELSSTVLWDKAHQVYLENALELGIPAALCLNLSILLLAVEALRGLWRRRDRTAPAIGVAATVLVAVHSLFDFSLQMPAVAAFYAFILGIAVAGAWPQPRPRGLA
ncbi:O-antigen ligase family protein [Parvibaculum sp.]|uniref:O-antigen ligase family protein n=1 Tax=Parvibaculum sp. TaxID=2024848 RepID=UPI003BABBDAB